MYRYAVLHADTIQIDALWEVYILHPVAFVHSGSWIRQILYRIVDGVNGSFVTQILRDVIGVFANLYVLIVARHVDDTIRAVRYIVAYQLPSVGKGVITQGTM